MRQRRPLERTEFVALVEQRGGDSEAAEWIWDSLRADCANDDFSPHPEDSFSRVFGIVEEDLDDDFVLGVFRELKLTRPTTAEAAQFGTIDTPLRLAQFVAKCRNKP